MSAFVPILGTTFAIKSALKALGGRWDAGNRVWEVPACKAVEARRLAKDEYRRVCTHPNSWDENQEEQSRQVAYAQSAAEDWAETREYARMVKADPEAAEARIAWLKSEAIRLKAEYIAEYE